jgi:hypothetical protein
MPTTELATWDLVAGFISATFILPVLQQPRWSKQTRAVLTFVWCVIVGLVAAWLTGAFDGAGGGHSAVSSVLLTLVSAIASYKGFSQPTGIAGAIENATAVGRHRAPE